MLTNLTIENIALLKEADLSFEPGLTALTGETGAGKSVIITALSLALGGRAEREYVRHGASKAEVEATFDLSFPAESEKDSVRVGRSVASDGGSRATIDGARASLAELRSLMSGKAEILGQHANQVLMDEANHLVFLDRYADLTEQRERLAEIFGRWQTREEERRRTVARREQLVRERELLLYQRDEIARAEIRVGEEEELMSERKVLDSARTLMTAASSFGEMIDGDGPCALGQIAMALRELETMAEADVSVTARVDELRDVQIRLEDLRRDIQQYGASIQDDPARVEEINIRLDEIYALKKKYGGSESSIVRTLEAIEDQLKNRPDTESLIAGLENECKELRGQYERLALALTRQRTRAARQLQQEVQQELEELAIEGAALRMELLYEDDPEGILIDDRAVKPTSRGLEQARIMFSANPGEPLRSLVKTASGGETSRVLLALKSAERRSRQMSGALLVFDEVDAGIGGRTAVAVGEKLKALASECQVLVVTHLHQIARMADHHLVAEKEQNSDGRSVIRVRRLEGDAIATELDRMVALPADA